MDTIATVVIALSSAAGAREGVAGPAGEDAQAVGAHSRAGPKWPRR